MYMHVYKLFFLFSFSYIHIICILEIDRRKLLVELSFVQKYNMQEWDAKCYKVYFFKALVGWFERNANVEAFYLWLVKVFRFVDLGVIQHFACRLVVIRYSNPRQIISYNWSPPQQGRYKEAIS